MGSNPPTFKKDTREIFANPKTFFREGVGGLREKKHELCQIVETANKQQHLHDAII